MNRVMKLFSEVLKPVFTWALIFVIFISQGITAEAKRSSLRSRAGEGLRSAGISNIVSPIAPLGVDDNSTEARVLGNLARSSEATSAASSSTNEESKLVMSKGAEATYILSSPDAASDEDSNKVGVLYKDCGGKILERKDGWTKISSGDVIGWTEDKNLLFEDDAEKLASEVGKQIVTSQSSALNVRSGASDSADVIGVLSEKTFVDMIEDLGNGWIAVDYNDRKGYVQSDYVTTDFKIDQGESMAAIKIRENHKKGRQAATAPELRENRGAMEASPDELKLLAALIQCEAGNQPYDGRVAVGAVVMNRVKSGAYPDTIYGVIYASGQFTPALNGTVAKVYDSGKIYDMNYQAAQAALNGETTVGSALHFRRINGREGIIIGEHVFW